MTSSRLLALQRSAGNRAVGGLLARQAAQIDPPPTTDASALAYARRFSAARQRIPSNATYNLFRHLVREHLPDLWLTLGRDWTFDDYPFQTFTFEVIRDRPGMAPHIGIGPELFRRVAGGEQAAVIAELRTTVAQLRAPTPAAFQEPAAVAQQRQQIDAGFGVHVQQGGNQPWTAGDLNDLSRALTMCTPRERAFVAGFQFWRFTDDVARRAQLGGGQAAGGDPGAITEIDDQVPPGLARISVFNEGLGRPATLPGGIRSLQRTQHGGVAFGVYTILHEIGHTIEGSGRFRAAIMTQFAALHAHAQQPITNGPQSRGNDIREIYCEGFARFHADPEGLAQRSQGIANFFRTGQHLPR